MGTDGLSVSKKGFELQIETSIVNDCELFTVEDGCGYVDAKTYSLLIHVEIVVEDNTSNQE
jgi:hypothetical protein